MRLDELHRGARFRMADLPGRTGTLLRLNEGSATVRWEGRKHRQFTDRKTGELVEFDVGHGEVRIARETEVVLFSKSREAIA